MIFIGTSGYNYAYWKTRFYPEKLPASKFLSYYSSQFNTVELNSSFYRFPTIENLRKAADQTPDDFRFSIKVHKIITHSRRLKDVADKIREFMDIVREGLDNKLSCVLFQLPPSYGFSEERLDDVIRYLSNDPRNVVEFRHVSWWNIRAYQALEENRINFCSVSFPGLPDDIIATGNLIYLRMHGVPNLFSSSYSDEILAALWAQIPPGKDAFIYFNNTMFEAGYNNARSLQDLAR